MSDSRNDLERDLCDALGLGPNVARVELVMDATTGNALTVTYVLVPDDMRRLVAEMRRYRVILEPIDG